MSLTKIDCLTYSKERPRSFGETLFNPMIKPGVVVMAISNPSAETIGAHVATQLALQYFVDGVMEFCEENKKNETENKDEEVTGNTSNNAKNKKNIEKKQEDDVIDGFSHAIVSAGFKNANRSVYDFGHKLAAGGRMKTYLTALAISNGVASVAKVGDGDVYLFRGGNLYSFFGNADSINDDSNVGQNSRVNVQFSDIELKEGDKLFLMSKMMTKREIEICESLVGRIGELNQVIFDKLISKLQEDKSMFKTGMVVELKEDSFFLGKESVA